MDYDAVYDGPNANDIMVIRMTRRQWWHIDDSRAEHPDRYPKRAAEREAAWQAIDNARPETALAEVVRADARRYEGDLRKLAECD